MSEGCRDHECYGHSFASRSSLVQSLDELDFERGIWQAAIDNDVAKVRALIEKGTSVDVKDNSGYTALHYGSRAGNTKIVEYLLDHGANPNAQTKSGKETPLHRAAYQGHENIVTLLLKHGANPFLQNSDGETALHKAASRKLYTVTNILLENSPDLVRVVDKKGKGANIS